MSKLFSVNDSLIVKAKKENGGVNVNTRYLQLHQVVPFTIGFELLGVLKVQDTNRLTKEGEDKCWVDGHCHRDVRTIRDVDQRNAD